jgi:hypothetical protein
MSPLTIEELTDIPLFALRAQLRMDREREDQDRMAADADWLARVPWPTRLSGRRLLAETPKSGS